MIGKSAHISLTEKFTKNTNISTHFRSCNLLPYSSSKSMTSGHILNNFSFEVKGRETLSFLTTFARLSTDAKGSPRRSVHISYIKLVVSTYADAPR